MVQRLLHLQWELFTVQFDKFWSMILFATCNANWFQGLNCSLYHWYRGLCFSNTKKGKDWNNSTFIFVTSFKTCDDHCDCIPGTCNRIMTKKVKSKLWNGLSEIFNETVGWQGGVVGDYLLSIYEGKAVLIIKKGRIGGKTDYRSWKMKLLLFCQFAEN